MAASLEAQRAANKQKKKIAAATSSRAYNSRVEEIGRACLECDCPSGYIPHPFRKTCNNCKCPKDAHDLFHDEWLSIREQLGLGSNTTDPFTRFSNLRPPPNQPGYAWTPNNLSEQQVTDFFKGFPLDKIPRAGTAGETYRDRQLLHQIPKQDLALAYCKYVEKEHHSAYEDFVNARNEVALDVGFAAPIDIPDTECHKCREVIRVGQLGVFAPKFGDGVAFHPTHFVCSVCSEYLVDLTYCNFNDALFCERHYAEELRPRCGSCDEVINSRHPT